MTDARESTKGAYGRLDRAVIMAAALRVAAAPGVSEIRFRDLGVELGADPTAVYRHFRNKDQLVSALIDRLMVIVADRIEGSLPPRELIEVMSEVLFDVFLEHPPIGFHLADVRPVGPGELRLAELALSALERWGMAGDELVRHYGTLSAFALSYLSNACREKVARARGEVEGMPWFPEAESMSGPSYPSLERHGEALAALDFRTTYFCGIGVILDAIELTLATAG